MRATCSPIICQAAFKNFAHPGRALEEMYRVLRAGGLAIIQDMSRDASNADIGREVSRMRLGRVSTFTTKWTLRMLRRRAYTIERFRELASASPFGTCDIQASGIGLDVRLKKL